MDCGIVTVATVVAQRGIGVWTAGNWNFFDRNEFLHFDIFTILNLDIVVLNILKLGIS